MRLSAQDLFFDAKTLSGTSVTSDVLDMSTASIAEFPAKVGMGGTATGVSTVTLQGSDDNSTWVSLGVANAVTQAIPIPQGCPQYLRLVVAGTSMSGTLTAGITLCAASPAGKRLGNYAANV